MRPGVKPDMPLSALASTSTPFPCLDVRLRAATAPEPRVEQPVATVLTPFGRRCISGSRHIKTLEHRVGSLDQDGIEARARPFRCGSWRRKDRRRRGAYREPPCDPPWLRQTRRSASSGRGPGCGRSRACRAHHRGGGRVGYATPCRRREGKDGSDGTSRRALEPRSPRAGRADLRRTRSVHRRHRPRSACRRRGQPRRS